MMELWVGFWTNDFYPLCKYLLSTHVDFKLFIPPLILQVLDITPIAWSLYDHTYTHLNYINFTMRIITWIHYYFSACLEAPATVINHNKHIIYLGNIYIYWSIILSLQIKDRTSVTFAQKRSNTNTIWQNTRDCTVVRSRSSVPNAWNGSRIRVHTASTWTTDSRTANRTESKFDRSTQNRQYI
jgi:hypothetical protein